MEPHWRRKHSKERNICFLYFFFALCGWGVVIDFQAKYLPSWQCLPFSGFQYLTHHGHGHGLCIVTLGNTFACQLCTGCGANFTLLLDNVWELIRGLWLKTKCPHTTKWLWRMGNIFLPPSKTIFLPGPSRGTPSKTIVIAGPKGPSARAKRKRPIGRLSSSYQKFL